MEDVCSLSSNKPEECWLKLGESIRHHAHGCRLYGYRVSYEIIDGYEQSFVPYHTIVNWNIKCLFPPAFLTFQQFPIILNHYTLSATKSPNFKLQT